MTGNAKLRADAFRNIERLAVVLHDLQQSQCILSILFGVKRKRRIVSRDFVSIAIIGFFFLQASGVRKQYPQEFSGAARAIDWPTKALLHKAR
jgi:hypothetical protein